MEFAQLFYNAGRDRNYWEKNSWWDIYFVLPSQIWIHSLIKTFWIRHAGLYVCSRRLQYCADPDTKHFAVTGSDYL